MYLIQVFQFTCCSDLVAFKFQVNKTGEDSKITMYDMAAAAGASKDMLYVIRDRQSVQKALSWI